MHGITLTKRPADWEILQQRDGFAFAHLEGNFQVHPAAIQVGVEQVRPLYRIMKEEDNSPVIPWTPLSCHILPDFSGSFQDTIQIPAGGLYRIETCLETKSTTPGLTWLYRGDCSLHIGAGNLFLLAGQSNSAGYGRDYAMDPPHLCVHLYRNRSRWDLACHPMNESTDAGSLPNEEMGIPGVSPYLSFAKNFYEFSRCPVGLIQTTLGGSPISRWNPETGDLYQNMLQKIHETGGQYAGILWYQGCSDGDPKNAPHYGERFAQLVRSVRRELGYDIPFFTFQLNRFVDCKEDISWGQIREAQRQAAHQLPAVSILPTINIPMSDAIHNSAHGNMLLGERLARQVGHVLLGMEEFEAPALSHAELLSASEAAHQESDAQPILRLTFSHVRLGFLYLSSEPEANDFLVEDESGPITITGFRCAREDQNHVYLTLERIPGANACISFAWKADPTRVPITDEVTFLPPLSFYQLPLPYEEETEDL